VCSKTEMRLRAIFSPKHTSMKRFDDLVYMKWFDDLVLCILTCTLVVVL
jgi:thermostable 8-oxoguanine DNA glycosylase